MLVAMSFVTFGQRWTALSSNTPAQPQVKLISSSEEQIVVSFTLEGFSTTRVETPNGTQNIISVPKMAPTLIAGAPNLPHYPIPALIGDMAEMGVKVTDAQFTDFNIEVAPSKGNISRQIDPETVAYTYGEMYSQNAFYPAEQAYLEAPYIIRDFRGQNIMVTPFAYNPVTKTLRVFTSMTITMTKLSDNGENPKAARKSNAIKVDPEMKNAYGRRFINFGMQTAKYTFIEDQGEMLVICPEQYMEAMQPFVDWKNMSGRPTTMVSVADAGGNNDNNIKAYIRELYENKGLTFILLVGDYADITPHSMGYSGRSDNWFAQLDGNDYYVEAFVGRFSVESVADVENHVNKVLYYERDMPAGLTWLDKGVGIGSTDGQGQGHMGGESDWRHIEYIRDTLMHYTYTEVSQRYDRYNNPTAALLSQDFNNGASLCNYCNHGSETSWGVCGYSNSHVNALTNDYMWPMVISVACLNGKFDHNQPCFGETWMRATNTTTQAPTGAIGGMFSWISQPWTPPQYGQDEMNAILTEWRNTDLFNHTMGGFFLNGNEYVLDASPEDQGDTHNTWIMFGDPSLMVRTTNPTEMNVTASPSTLLIGMNELGITVDADYAIATLSLNGEVLASTEIIGGNGTLTFEPLTNVGNANLVILGYNKVTYNDEIEVIPADGAFVTVSSYMPSFAAVNHETSLSMSFKNVGSDPTSGNTEVVLTCDDERLQFINSTATLDVMQGNEIVDLNDAFSFIIAEGVEDGTRFTIDVTMTCGNEVWNGKAIITAAQAVLEFGQFIAPAGFVPGETVTIAATFKNVGHYMATTALATISSTSEYVTFEEETFEVGTIESEGTATCVFHATIDAACPETEQLPFTLNIFADGDLSAEGSGVLKNACAVIFDLADSYGDGWNGAKLHVVYSDDTPAEDMTISSGNSATYTREIGNGVHVTVNFIGGYYDSECSYSVKYEDGTIIYQGGHGNCDFDVNCAGGPIGEDLYPVENLVANLEGNVVTLTWDAPENAISYNIYRNGIMIAEEIAETTYQEEVDAEMTNNYGVTAVYAEGESLPESVLVVIDLGVEESETEFSIYPNPVNNTLYINGGNAEFSYVMYNGMGQQVANGTAQGAQQISVSDMSKGVYFIRITSGSQTSIQKVVVE